MRAFVSGVFDIQSTQFGVLVSAVLLLLCTNGGVPRCTAVSYALNIVRSSLFGRR